MSFCLRPNVCKKCGKPLTMFEGWTCIECEKAEQEPCDDAISRKSIKQKLQEHHDFFVNAYGGFSNLPQNDKARVDEITNCIAMVVNEPPVTQKPETVTEFADRCRECGAKYGKLLEQRSGKWIALVARPMTNEEREYYSEQLDYCDGDAIVYNCPLPEEGQDVLITTCTGAVLIDTFFNDYDGCGFEGYDIEDVKAWMPLPKPYEPHESEVEE